MGGCGRGCRDVDGEPRSNVAELPIDEARRPGRVAKEVERFWGKEQLEQRRIGGRSSVFCSSAFFYPFRSFLYKGLGSFMMIHNEVDGTKEAPC